MIELQKDITYGPILSRRLGRSLGINLSGTTRKKCNFNCVYCQYGFTPTGKWDQGKLDLPSISDVILAVEKKLKKPFSIDHITFSGNGEPTLHPGFEEIVEGVVDLRNRYRPGAKIAVLSNGSRVKDPGVHRALSLVDSPFLKLDAGMQSMFDAINASLEPVNLDELIESYCSVKHCILQSIFFTYQGIEVDDHALDAWINAVKRVNPAGIHLYSLDRPAAAQGLEEFSGQALADIASKLGQLTGIPASVFI